MTDNFNTFEKHNVQINVFHVKEAVKGDKDTKNKLLHKEAYLFNVKDKPIIDFPKKEIKQIDEKIYLSDTNEILLEKIANNCTNGLNKKDIYAWIDHNPDKKLLAYSKPIGINYNDLDKLKYMNPLRETKIDDDFVNSDGTLKFNTKTYFEHHKILNHQFLNDKYNIYFCTIEDCIEYGKILSDEEEMIKNGYLKKYFPFYEDPNDNKIVEKIKLIESQRNLVNDYNIQPVDSRPILIKYENNKRESLLDIFKIFQSYEVNIDIPYMKIQNDNYMDSYVKFYKDGINTTYKENKDKNITIDLFEKWGKNIYIHDGLMRPKGIDKNDTLTFIIYDKNRQNFAHLIIDIKSSVQFYFEGSTKIEKFSESVIKKLLLKANSLLNTLNKGLKNTIPKIIQNPSRIDISYIYEISDYHLPTLVKLFQSFYTKFIILSKLDEKIQLLYSKCDDYSNPKNITDFITFCKRIKDISDDDIIDSLERKFIITKKAATENLDDWKRVSETKSLRYNNEIKNISIIIEKVLDRIKISLFGHQNFNQLHECIHDINGVLGIYNEKRIKKNKDLPSEIQVLFKKSNKKMIISDSVKLTNDSFKETDSTKVEEVVEREPEPESEEISITTDEVKEDSDEDSDDEYERIDMMGGGKAGVGKYTGEAGNLKNMIGGGLADKDDESIYPNSRYYIKRLEAKDPRLIKYKSKKNKDGYAYKCQASHDKQPISLTFDELKEIDHKTGFKNEGISYSKAIRIDGGDRPDIYYICPKFWDRKHQIPLDPKAKYHPIEVDENGEKKVEYRDFVWSKEMKNSDGDKFILERTGRPANRPDSSSYWNKDKDHKDDINYYNVQFIHDDIHPELLALPCCGKKNVKITKKDIYVLEENPPKWVSGVIISDINDKDEYMIRVQNKEKYFHISRIKERKGTKVRLTTDFPLKENTNGHVCDILKGMFYINIDAPFIRDRSGEKSKMRENGFFRKGVIQGSDSFLRCLDMIHCMKGGPDYLKLSKRNYSDFKLKNLLIDDLELLSDNDFYSIGGGSFVQYFRDVNSKSILESVKTNFINYLKSDEPKDEKLLIPLLIKISECSNNKSFDNIPINILVFHESNEKVSLIEPYGKLEIIENRPYALIYKKDNKYECLIYYYNNYAYGYLLNIKDKSSIEKDNVIYIQNQVAEVIKKSNKKLTINYFDKDIKAEIDNSKDLIKYDMSCITHILEKFIRDNKSKSISNKKDIITKDELNFVMTEVLNYKIIESYYDRYNKLVAFKYKHNKTSKEFPIFFKPESKQDMSIKKKSIQSMDNYSLEFIIRIYKVIDKKINEIYPDKYKSFIDDKMKCITNSFNLLIGLLMSNGFIVPLKHSKYNENKHKYKSLNNPSLLNLQNKQLDDYQIKNPSDVYFHKKEKEKSESLKIFKSIYNEIIKNERFKNDILKEINHPIKLLIHKRYALVNLINANKNIKIKELKYVKLFIEYLCIHGVEGIEKYLFRNYSSLKDYKMNMISDEFIIFNMKEIIMEIYKDLFLKKSDYLRNISYYEHSNPDVNKILLRREYIEKPVSFYSKYPNTLKKILGKDITIYKNVISEDRNDINIIVRLLDDISVEQIRSILIDKYSLDDDSYKSHNNILGDIYKDNRELLSSISNKYYKLSLIDYENISENLSIGFFLISNRYSNDSNKYKTHIIIHKSLRNENISDIKMLCLYEDISEEIPEDSECKPISINDKLIHVFGDLKKNKEFNKIYNKT